jgi:hypothetical protein
LSFTRGVFGGMVACTWCIVEIMAREVPSAIKVYIRGSGSVSKRLSVFERMAMVTWRGSTIEIETKIGAVCIQLMFLQ